MDCTSRTDTPPGKQSPPLVPMARHTQPLIHLSAGVHPPVGHVLGRPRLAPPRALFLGEPHPRRRHPRAPRRPVLGPVASAALDLSSRPRHPLLHRRAVRCRGCASRAAGTAKGHDVAGGHRGQDAAGGGCAVPGGGGVGAWSPAAAQHSGGRPASPSTRRPIGSPSRPCDRRKLRTTPATQPNASDARVPDAPRRCVNTHSRPPVSTVFLLPNHAGGAPPDRPLALVATHTPTNPPR